jgi:flagellar hook protein FlgE
MSFDIALSGIQAINEQLEIVSNNIANSSTYGFKSSRANFASMYAGAQPSGVEVGSTTQFIGVNGSTQTTGRALDASIQGRGFFVSRDQSGVTSYSRVGIFNVDKSGYLIDNFNRQVQGYGPTNGGALGVPGSIQVPTGQIPAVASTTLTYVGNMSADWTVPAVLPFNPANSQTYNMVKQSVLYDSLGTKHTVSQYFVKAAAPANTVVVHYGFDNAPPLAADTDTLNFTPTGQLVPLVPPATRPTMTVPAPGAAPLNFTINYTGTTQFAGAQTTTTNEPDGYRSGVYIGVVLGTDGSVIAKYDNDKQQVVGTIALATFANEGALSPISDTSWVANSDSGAALVDPPGTGLNGKLATSTLEGSNVDVTAELVGLMTSQRNYQANSKVISTENAMVQALMQAM